MKFSIVITTYNRITLLKRAIDCALNQTVPCEVVVADDCSTDGTEEYVRELSASLKTKEDYRLVYHRNLTNQGHSATMNAGVAVASGEWIKPVDDDDYLATDCIEEMIQAISAYQIHKSQTSTSQVVICSCQAAQVDPSEKELSRTRIIGPGKVFYIPQEDIHYGMLLEQIPFGTPIQVAYRKDAFIHSGGWDSSLDANCDDIDSWIRISQFGDAIFINKCLAYRTIWPGAYNQKISLEKRLDTNILIKEKLYQLVQREHKIHLPTLQDIRNYLKLHWSIVALKKAKIVNAFSLSSASILSPKAWKLLLSSILNRKQQWLKIKQLFMLNKEPKPLIKKIILIE
ncbi:GalNAc(5)-diNAcBac-PP-undecaprenol beta-1,3-glucosyltransferase [Planktothrix tepida]|uniref:Glycosyl transferase n=2 Tax=Planktothrix TaxID=54304 RepID=A0A1J1LHW0_9CYAN